MLRVRSFVCGLLLVGCGAAPAGETGGETATEESGGATAATGAGFVVGADLGAPECDPGAQDCGAGQKCTPYASDGGCCVDTTHCVAITGGRAEGEACTRAAGDDDCAAGLFCLTAQSGGSGPGACIALCDVADPAACGGDHCVQFNGGVLPLCKAACDPLVQDCPEGQACYASLTEQVFVCLDSSYAPGAGQAGQPCATISACEAGLLCAPATELVGCPAKLCCTPLCPIGSAQCPAPYSCEQVYDVEQFPAYAGVGYCRQPP